MATEGIKQLKFANRQNVLATTHTVALVTVMGDIRAEYVSGTENYITGDTGAYWVYQFNILEEDIPTGYSFDSINESVFKPPYLKAWVETDDDGCCHCFLAAGMEIDPDPAYLIGASERETDCEGAATEFCFTRLEPDALAAAVQPFLDPEALADALDTYLHIHCTYGDPLITQCP